jgi:hypothetical protein
MHAIPRPAPADAAPATPLSLLGGPLHRLGRRLGLVRGDANTLPLGLALGAALWVVVVLLGTAEALGGRLFSLAGIGGHVRLLVAIPLLFACEAMFDPGVRGFVARIVRSGVVPAKELPALEAQIARTVRWKDSWLPDALCLLAAILMAVLGAGQNLYGESARAVSLLEGPGTLTGLWYWGVCLTLFRFLLLRWAWRLALWCHFLWRLSRLELSLDASHPDGSAGIGGLEGVHGQLGPLVFAISALEAASFAEDIAAGSMAVEAIYPPLALLILGNAVLVFGPLFIFTPLLWRARMEGGGRHAELASHYIEAFRAKWFAGKPAEPLLGSSDIQSLADLGTVIDRIKATRWVPFGRRLVTITLAAVLVPAAPLVLFKYPLTDLIQKLSARLLGL